MGERRYSAVSGRFYPDSADECRRELESYTTAPAVEYSGTPRAGIVPHAGWVFSGPTAGKVFAFFKKHAAPETFILYGAVHRFMGEAPVVMSSGEWETPLGDARIDEELAGELLGGAQGLEEGAAPHSGEHSIEVQVPFIKYLFPEAKIVPILAPPTAGAAKLGEAVGKIIAGRENVAAMASTDLTHYGPEYGFAPKGTGEEALRWAKEINDRRILDLAEGMEAEKVVGEAREHHNACGAGAVAAAVATARSCGKTRGVLLEHTTSYEVMPRGRPSMAVGYAGMIF